MANVVTYWQTQEDEKSFLDYLQTTGVIVAFTDQWVESRDLLRAEPIATFIERNDPDQFLFARQDLLQPSDVERREFGGKMLFGLPHMKANVIAYDRGKLSDGRLPHSNLSAYSVYPNASASAFVEKSAEFLAWMKKVMSWVRRLTPDKVECNGFFYRATKRAGQAVAEGWLSP